MKIKKNFPIVLMSILLILLGFVFSWYFSEPILVNRFSSFVIVIGVLFGISSYKKNRMDASKKLHKIRKEILAKNTQDRNEEAKIGLPDELMTPESKSSQTEIDDMMARSESKILWLEASVICIGTLFNSWGDLLSKIIINY